MTPEMSSAEEDPRTPLLLEERVFHFPSVKKNFLRPAPAPGWGPKHPSVSPSPSPIYPTSTPLTIPLNNFGK